MVLPACEVLLVHQLRYFLLDFEFLANRIIRRARLTRYDREFIHRPDFVAVFVVHWSKCCFSRLWRLSDIPGAVEAEAFWGPEPSACCGKIG